MAMVSTLKTRLLHAVLCSSLGVAGFACGDDEDSGDDGEPRNDASTGTPDASGGNVDANVRDTSTAGDAGSAPEACLDAVYSELETECKTCICMVNAETAPVCDGPCWEFLACSSVANAGACREFTPMSQAANDCIASECGAELSAPGVSPKAGAYGTAGIARACFPSACVTSIGKIRQN
jgi:hypothetical protein